MQQYGTFISCQMPTLQTGHSLYPVIWGKNLLYRTTCAFLKFPEFYTTFAEWLWLISPNKYVPKGALGSGVRFSGWQIRRTHGSSVQFGFQKL